jgi:hypothetical protein
MKIYETRNELINELDKDLIICEIGVFKGEFSRIIHENIKPKELHLVDIFEGMMCSGNKDGENIVWTNLNEEYEKIKNYFIKDESVFIHKGHSDKILNEFPNKYFDLIYIDGDHSYEGVKKDLNISLLKIKNGGFIFGHDYSPTKFPQVVRAVDEFCVENNLSISYLTNDGCPTFGIIKK